VYKNVEDVCERCARREQGCGEKLPGPVQQQRAVRNGRLEHFALAIPVSLVLPADERLTDIDAKYILNLSAQLSLHEFQGPDYIKLVYDISEPIYVATFDLGSKIFRFAFLAYAASHSLEPDAEQDSMQYLGKFYKYYRESTDATDLEIVMASYMAFSNECTKQHPHEDFLNAMLVHFNGMCAAVRNLSNRTDQRTDRIVQAVQDVFVAMLTSVFWRFNSITTDGTVDSELLVKLGHSIELAMNVIDTDYPFQDGLLKLCALDNCFNLFLIWANNSKLGSRFRTRNLAIHDLVQKIERQVSELPTSRDLLQLAFTDYLPSSFTWPDFGESWAIRLLVHSIFICNVTNGMDVTKEELEMRAKALCFLYSESQLYSDEWTSLCEAARGLFWAGLILTESMDRASNLILSFVLIMLGNQFIFTKLNDVHRKLLRLAETEEIEQRVRDILRCVFQSLYRANEVSISEMLQSAVMEDEVWKCDCMLVRLRFSSWEREWYR